MDTSDFLILSIISLVGWVVVGVRLMGLCNASGVSSGWMSFIPVLNLTRWARLAGANPWLVAIWLIPLIGWLIGVVLSFVWLNKVSEATGTKSPWFIVYVVAFLASIVQGGVIHGVIGWLIAVVLTLGSIYSLWMIFDPTKPIAAKA